MRFDNVNRTHDSDELDVVSFGTDFMGNTADGKEPYTHQISNFGAVNRCCPLTLRSWADESCVFHTQPETRI